ncbi:MAG: GntR family transcriptional regulator [Firmicutes bacterium]|nr:GntR family transcriptional regulator [Bacillota bacterium]
MIFAAGDTKPIYLQISDWLEAEILSGNLTAGEKIYSQYQLAEMFNINPATAAKGLNILADESILYKKRGLGMFITPDAGLIIRKKRREQILERLVLDLVKEARLLDIPESGIISMIKDALNRE